jgi:hypothetical protein
MSLEPMAGDSLSRYTVNVNSVDLHCLRCNLEAKITSMSDLQTLSLKGTNVRYRDRRLPQVDIQNGMINGYGNVQSWCELHWVPAKTRVLLSEFFITLVNLIDANLSRHPSCPCWIIVTKVLRCEGLRDTGRNRVSPETLCDARRRAATFIEV